MKRILLVVTVALVMAAMMVASAAPAFAVASEKANCAGEDASGKATSDGKSFGQANAQNAQDFQGIGQEISPQTSSNCGAR
jgi:hypothetical protein